MSPNELNISFLISAIGVPIIGALFFMIRSNKSENDRLIQQLEEYIKIEIINLNEKFLEYKLTVAKEYVSISYLKDVEKRLTNHLIRIEEGLKDVGGFHGK